jgi:hypothetical protein
MSAGQAHIVTRWGAPFGPYLTTVIGLAFWMTVAMAGLSALLGLLLEAVVTGIRAWAAWLG